MEPHKFRQSASICKLTRVIGSVFTTPRSLVVATIGGSCRFFQSLDSRTQARDHRKLAFDASMYF